MAEKVYGSPYQEYDLNLTETNFGEFLRQGFKNHPDNIFVDALTDSQYTATEALDLSTTIECALHNLGLVKNDVVAICSTNTVRTPIFLSAVWARNAAASGLDFGFREDEYIDLATVYQPKIFVCNTANIAVAKEVMLELTCCELVIVLDCDTPLATPDILSFHDLLTLGRKERTSLKTDVIPQQLAYLPRTSGTTGRSKAVMHTHRTLTAAVLAQSAPDVMCLPSGARVLSSSSLHHVYCLFDVFSSCVHRGFNFLTSQSNDPAVIMQQLQQNQVTCMTTTPYIVLGMLNLHKTANKVLENLDISSLKSIIVGSNIFPEDALDMLKQCFPKLESFGNLYGQTEILSCTSHAFNTFYKPCTIGPILAHGKFRVVDVESMQDVDLGIRGELWVKLPQQLVGYYSDPKASEEAFHDGWYRTGDICTVDSEGCLSLVDRLKEFIKTKYTTISPGEVEAKLLKHPKIADVAVIGLPHPLLQTAIHAIIAHNAPITEEEIHTFMAETTPDIYKLEGGVTLCEKVPRTPMGKLMRRQLVEWVLAKRHPENGS